MKSLPFIFLALLALSASANSEDEAVAAEGEGQAPVAAIYIPLKPQFVVNYGGALGKAHFLKAEVTLRLADSEAASSVRHHLPYIRNNLVMAFASQTNETLQSQDGREALRVLALSEIREIIKREDGIDGEKVVDVLFNKFTWH